MAHLLRSDLTRSYPTLMINGKACEYVFMTSTYCAFGDAVKGSDAETLPVQSQWMSLEPKIKHAARMVVDFDLRRILVLRIMS